MQIFATQRYVMFIRSMEVSVIIYVPILFFYLVFGNGLEGCEGHLLV